MACSSNAAMVKRLCAEGVLTSPEVIEAFRSVDRGDFVPSSGRFGADRAYANVPVRIGNFHLSAPFIYGVALEALGVRRGVRFINVGSGTGYLSSIVAVLLGGTGTNHGVEARDELVGFARRRVPSAEFLLGNALSLDPVSSRGAYDRVFVGAGCDAARASHFALLLKVGGVLVGPVENELLRIERFSTHVFSSATLMSVKFSPLLVPSPTRSDPAAGPRLGRLRPLLGPLSMASRMRGSSPTVLESVNSVGNVQSLAWITMSNLPAMRDDGAGTRVMKSRGVRDVGSGQR